MDESVKGNIKGGKQINLRFASNSSVACFPGTQNEYYNGNQVFYAFKLPPRSEVNIALKGNDVSIYGYQIGATRYDVPPALSRVTSCEAAYKPGRDGSPPSIFFNSIKNPYNVVVAVAGANGKTSGAFELSIDLVTHVPEDAKITDDQPAKVYRIEAEKGKILTFKGNLFEGKRIPLEWAANSSVACFPGTQFERYRGNTVFYTLEIPRYSNMVLKLESDEDINIWALQGHDGKTLPPDIHRCVTCEASEGRKNGERTIFLNAINNPYKILVGVAGAKGVTKGEYRLMVELTDR
ncbi:MAG: hypothetical protein AAF570_04995 [Bacteroidota bacterium]